MSFLGGGYGLKHEHKIYDEDFTSKEEFSRYLKIKEEQIENIKSKVVEARDRNWDYFANHDLEDTVFDKFDDMIQILEDKRSQINNSINDLKE